MSDREQHIAQLKKAIEQNEKSLVELRKLVTDLEVCCNESEQRHKVHLTGLPSPDQTPPARQALR